MLVQFARAIGFIAVAVLVFGHAARAAARWARGRRLPAAPGERAALAAGFAGLLCLPYGWLVEPYWPEVRALRVEHPRLVGLARPLRLVLLSDIHSDASPRLEPRLPGLVRALAPDAVLFAGDGVNSPRGLPVFRETMKALAAVAPTYAIRGNWDLRAWSYGLLDGTGARDMDARAEALAAGGGRVWVCGAPAWDADAGRRAVAAAPKDAFRIYLTHAPDEAEEAAAQGVELYLAGHTHGGQVALPFYGAIITLSRFDKRFESGLGRFGDMWLYVTRGIGMEGALLPRVRFFARPEITLIELAPGPESRAAVLAGPPAGSNLR